MQVVTKKQLKNKLMYLEALKGRLERGMDLIDGQLVPKAVNMVGKMLRYRALPQAEREQIANDWEGYYDLVKHSRAYERYQEQRQAYRENRMDRVRGLAAEARQDLEQKTDWIPKPSSVDPDEFSRHYDCQRYWRTIKAINDTKEALKRMGDEETLAEEIFA
jgi:hypothetical protein